MYVYIMRRESGGPCKIGISHDLRTRRNVISNRVDEVCDILFLLLATNARAIERAAHLELAAFDLGNEWFDVTEQKAIRTIVQIATSEKEISEMTAFGFF